MKKYEIAVIPGDGIGKEVVPAALHVLDAVSAKFGISVRIPPIRLELRDLQSNRPYDAGRRHCSTPRPPRDPAGCGWLPRRA